ncbi:MULTISPECIES: sensor histidine kinase [unclassified Leifsonia]|uniref:sensor histidine kinase n=1 Tax=unclassified Leifsonia TaxID=2663824 RepID=UPI0006FC7752|nr:MULTISPECIES: ATP-binding protein [unclassified Leifsonia]KQX07807.1 histidine kinase [Leifsonia sp. Root1293]KRA12089.1 histidine kinase [Leifsonia sp. Root60]
MDTTWLVLLSLALGLVVGGGFIALLHVAERRGTHAATVVNPSVPDGIAEVIDALESPAVVVDPSNNVLASSHAALTLGLVRLDALVHPELIEIVARVRRTGEPVAEQLTIARSRFGESNILLDVRAARLGSRYVLLLGDDLTDSQRLDEVRRDFIANISHELKTPIASVGLLAEAIDMAADEPAQVRRFTHRLTQEAARLARITQDIIDLSRLQSQDVLAKPDLVSVDEIVAAAVDQNRVVAEARDIALAVRNKSRAEVLGDESLLVMAVNNLIANAINYSLPGTRVGVGVKSTDGAVEIAVTDQGVGIPEEDLDRVFERFFRVDEARSRNTGGTGLGLSIVKHAVQNHGGDVRVWSQSGRGSTFTIRLPEAPIDAVKAEKDPQ